MPRTDAFTQTYVRSTPASQQHYRRTREIIPAGATRSLNSWPPHPLYLTGGDGARVTDLDGRVLTDFLNNYTALVLGHAHPEVVSAVQEAAALGTSFSFSSTLEQALGELLAERVPSMERLRFTGSGTEAVMFALRLARAATGRTRIAKAEGGFHGALDETMVNVRAGSSENRGSTRPRTVPDMEGLTPGVEERTLVLPFNDIEASTALIKEHAGDLAAVILEPVLGVGGMIPATESYLRAVRDACSEGGIVLIFDEVITLRLGPGGAQQSYGIAPDLTVTGKTIGGGMPIGAYGGRADLMALLEPQGGTDVYDAGSGGPRLYQGGTFTGNNCTLAAGVATLKTIDPETYTELNRQGDRLRETLNKEAESSGLPLHVTGTGSLFNLHACSGPVTGFRDAQDVAGDLQQALFLGLLEEGVIVAPRGMGCLSTAMTEDDLRFFQEKVLGVAERIDALL
ncbi:aspartate aminotransferase family protein [Nocardiopsis kunsanensis]|uniref:Aspartate aminotransferase family protein n=1 Tax=Nocardiopsis kunsanensis TaxID=141693 RepID=A0A918XMJ3_9ACTN|nr:aspartate aminotransferase family protein [Nocardiopsis kunsanensis]GHD37230.1 aspartate aminotransferase family protein [Nocardiopsis kunsanensis]